MELVKIGRLFKTLLLSNEEVQDKIEDRVFPLVAVEGTKFPFLVYRRYAYRPTNNKDFEDEIISLEIAILSPKYEESVDVTDAVINAVNRKQTEEIENIKIMGSSEEFSGDTYIQKLQIDIYLK